MVTLQYKVNLRTGLNLAPTGFKRTTRERRDKGEPVETVGIESPEDLIEDLDQAL